MGGLKKHLFNFGQFIFSLGPMGKKKGADIPHSVRRILLVKTHAIGDTLLIVPAMNALRKRFPKAHIALLTGQSPKEIIEGNSDIDTILSFDESALFTPDIAQLIGLIKKVRKEKFELVFTFHYSAFMHLLVFLFGIPLRVGYDLDGTGFSLTHKIPWDRKGERWTADVHMDIVKAAGAQPHDNTLRIDISSEHMRFADAFVKDHNIGRQDILIGIFPGGGKNSRDTVYQKRWKIENFAEVIDKLSSKYNAKILLFGSLHDESILARLIALSASKVINACGRNLKQVSALIKNCSLLITNDSAPLHIAVAVDTPTVSLFGPSRASALIKQNYRHVVIQSAYPCSPCYCNSVFPGCDDPKCMDAIGCEEVVEAAERQLNKFCAVTHKD